MTEPRRVRRIYYALKIRKKQYLRELRKALTGCRSVLDVGCGARSPFRHFSSGRFSVGVDAFAPSIESSRAEGIHDRYELMDVLRLGEKFPAKAFDCVLALDIIEHLEKSDGYRLIESMERIALKKVVVFTPNGFLEQGVTDGNTHQVHRSGWEIAEFRTLGYTVTGINGWKGFRGEYGNLTWRPRWFWKHASSISQLWTTRHPERAFAILCVKQLNLDDGQYGRGVSVQNHA